MYLGSALLLVILFVGAPIVAAAVAYAAWQGKPKNFDREMYWTAFAASTGVSLILMVFAQRMQAQVGTWQYVVQVACFCLGALLFGVGGGCLLGMFVYRFGARSSDPPSQG